MKYKTRHTIGTFMLPISLLTGAISDLNFNSPYHEIIVASAFIIFIIGISLIIIKHGKFTSYQ